MEADYHPRQSPLFRIPREIRDEIYKHCIIEEHGYIYDFESAKMRVRTSANSTTCTSTQPIDMRFMRTCKLLAEEARGVSFRHNTLTFVTGFSEKDQGEYMGLTSRAGRFHCLLLYSQHTKIEMVRRAAECITADIHAKIAGRFPRVGDWFGVPLQTARPTRAPDDWFPVPGLARDGDILRHEVALAEDFDDGLQYALQLANAQPGSKFRSLASEAFCPLQPEDESRKDYVIGAHHRHYFIEGSLTRVLSWRPPVWSIPSEQELSAMQSLLTEHREDLNAREIPDSIIGTRPVLQLALAARSTSTKWRFSATAVAIDFLKRLSKELRYQMRDVVINEDYKAVGSPERHARGLIPFCTENPLLHVDLHTGLWTNLFPNDWSRIMDDRFRHEKYEDGRECLNVFFKWADEMEQLPLLGMPSGSLTVVFEGQSPETLQAWDLLKRAACMQEAMRTWSNRRSIHLRPRWRDSRIDHFDRFPLPCDVPPSFTRVVKDMVQGSSLMRFDGDPGELWDAEVLIAEAEDWTVDDWLEAWRKHVLWPRFSTAAWSADLPRRYNY